MSAPLRNAPLVRRRLVRTPKALAHVSKVVSSMGGSFRGCSDQPAATVMTNAALWLVSTKVKGFTDNSVNQHLTRFLSLQ